MISELVRSSAMIFDGAAAITLSWLIPPPAPASTMPGGRLPVVPTGRAGAGVPLLPLPVPMPKISPSLAASSVASAYLTWMM